MKFTPIIPYAASYGTIHQILGVKFHVKFVMELNMEFLMTFHVDRKFVDMNFPMKFLMNFFMSVE